MTGSTTPLLERPHPLYSPVALLSAALLIIGLALGLYFTGGRAYSPGHLSAVSHTARHSGDFASHADFGDVCTRCHTPFQGVQTARCEACHTDVAQARVASVGLHGHLASDDCVGCHQEHQGESVNLFTQAVEQFTPARHAQLVKLEGAHVDLDCDQCHASDRYAGTPTTCYGCHTEPALHSGLFGVDCANCHTSADWHPARLTQHVFPLDHGNMGETPCATCHTDTFTTYTCADCHTADDMRQTHGELALSGEALADCLACHPTGSVEEERTERPGSVRP